MNFTHSFLSPPEIIAETFEDGSRRYKTPEGNSYESVTTFISRNWDKSFLEKWKKRIGEAKAASESKRATSRGSKLHKVVETYLLNGEVRSQLNEHVLTKQLFVQIKPELNKINNIKLIEKSLYSDELKLAGTPDCIADYDNVLSTIDFKTSTKEKLEKYITTYWLQCSIYSTMFNERFGEMPNQSVIIMAVEEHPLPSVFIEPTYTGLQRLNEFLDNPNKFQEDLKK